MLVPSPIIIQVDASRTGVLRQDGGGHYIRRTAELQGQDAPEDFLRGSGQLVGSPEMTTMDLRDVFE